MDQRQLSADKKSNLQSPDTPLTSIFNYNYKQGKSNISGFCLVQYYHLIIIFRIGFFFFFEKKLPLMTASIIEFKE